MECIYGHRSNYFYRFIFYRYFYILSHVPSISDFLCKLFNCIPCVCINRARNCYYYIISFIYPVNPKQFYSSLFYHNVHFYTPIFAEENIRLTLLLGMSLSSAYIKYSNWCTKFQSKIVLSLFLKFLPIHAQRSKNEMFCAALCWLLQIMEREFSE